MIEKWKTEGTSDACLKHAFEFMTEYAEIKMWNSFRPIVAQAIIGVKKGLLPFCDRNGFVSDNLVREWGHDGCKKLEAKHYEFFRYDYQGLDVYVQLSHNNVTAFVLADIKKLHLEKIKRIEERKSEIKSEEEKEQMMNWYASDYGFARWGEYEELFDIIDNAGFRLGTNLTKEEFVQECEECLRNTALFVFDVQFNDRQWEIIKRDVETEELQPYLNKVLDLIKEKPDTSAYFLTNSYSTGISELEWKDAIDIKPLLCNTSEVGGLYGRWKELLFDLHIDFKYTGDKE